jgi:hypothetical protein
MGASMARARVSFVAFILKFDDDVRIGVRGAQREC